MRLVQCVCVTMLRAKSCEGCHVDTCSTDVARMSGYREAVAVLYVFKAFGTSESEFPSAPPSGSAENPATESEFVWKTWPL
mmetsp:Transcript_9809/g.21880  ORF Transcript_9809/g.21880 Transcript_9809/m.21880 type:complete len:81 (+) Transcript_9809:811-1053(+)